MFLEYCWPHGMSQSTCSSQIKAYLFYSNFFVWMSENSNFFSEIGIQTNKSLIFPKFKLFCWNRDSNKKKFDFQKKCWNFAFGLPPKADLWFFSENQTFSRNSNFFVWKNFEKITRFKEHFEKIKLFWWKNQIFLFE